MTNRARGTFEVKVVPQATEDQADTTLGRMSIDKKFQGDLDGTSTGQMLTAGMDVEGSAAYVAIEKVSGKLHARNGTFLLQHNGTMTRGTPALTITVVPDSATGELAGLTGRFDIKIDADGGHSYAFEYSINET